MPGNSRQPAIASSRAQSPWLSAELFTIALGDGKYLVYAPLRRAAFIANARLVNVLANLQSGGDDISAGVDGSLVEFMRGLEILDAPPELLPITVFGGEPQPTTITLFMTTACNLRRTNCI